MMGSNGRFQLDDIHAGITIIIRSKDGKEITYENVRKIESHFDIVGRKQYVYVSVDSLPDELKKTPEPEPIPDYTIQKYDHIRCRSCGVAWDAHATDPQSVDCRNKKPAEVPKLTESDKRSIEVNMK